MQEFYFLGKIKRPPIFILYALELDNFQKVIGEDYPTYSLVLDLVKMFYLLNIPCFHDGSECFQNDSIQDFSCKIERALKDSKAVVVICSEVLSTAFNDAAHSGRRQAQMKFGKFNVSKVSKYMMKSTDKFVPVTLTGVSSVCSELQNNRCFDLKNHGQFMVSIKTSSNVRSDPEFSEINELVLKLQQLISVV